MSEPSIVESCDNCGRTVGKLEKAHVWKEHIVCGVCIKKLTSSPNRSTRPILILGTVAVILCTFVAVIGGGLALNWWLHPEPVRPTVIAAPATVPPKPVARADAPMPAANQPPLSMPLANAIRTDLEAQFRIERLDLSGMMQGAFLECRILRIVNLSQTPVTIKKLILNDEYELPRVTIQGKNSIAPAVKNELLPVKLTIGEGADFLISRQGRAFGVAGDGELLGYAKSIVFYDVVSDQGTERVQNK